MPQRILEGSVDAYRRINAFSIRLLGLVARVRPDERRDALGALLTLFGFMTGHALLETARDALFLASIPARRLPWVYLIIAIVALALGQREPRVVRRISRRGELSRWLVLAAAVTLGFWTIVGTGRAWVLYALYVWSGVIASLVVVRFWTVLSGRFTVTQAKRVFPVIATGSVAGAIAGSAVARALTEVVPARHLVLAASVVFLLAALAPTVIPAEAPVQPRRTAAGDLGRIGRMIWTGPYLRRVTILVLLATITFTLVDFVFKSAAGRYVAPADLGEFFSSVYLSLNLLSLLVQVLVVGWLLRHVGLVSAVSVAPAILLMATLGFAVGGGLTLALVLKGADGTLRHSLYRTGTELLFVPLSDRLRTQVKGVIDVLGQRGGQALASIVILMVLSTTGELGVFAGLACLTAAGWLVVAVSLKEHYLNLFRETLSEEGWGRGLTEFPALDMASLETLLATLNAPDDRRVVAALNVLRDQGKAGVIPALLVYHPSPTVVVQALDVFVSARRDDFLPMARRLTNHPDPGVRAASQRAVSALSPDRQLLETGSEDPDPTVRVTAAVGLLAAGWEDGTRPETILDQALADGPDVQRALAQTIRLHPRPVFETTVLRLLQEDDADVLREAIAAAREVRSPALLQPLLALLARRSVREDARAALVGFGPLALTRLAEALDSMELPHAVRRHVPGALGLMGSTQAPELLLRHLQREPDGMIRFKILRALGRWRNEQPNLPLDPALLQDALGQAMSTGFRLMGWRRDLDRSVDAAVRTELHFVLRALLRDKEDHTLERVFRLLNLQSGSEEFQRIYRGLHSPRVASRAGSRELLQHMVVTAVRKPLLTLVDDLQSEDGGGEARWTDGPPEGVPYAGVLEDLVNSGMESVSSLAAAHAAELGLVELAQVISECPPLSDEHRSSLRRAARTLGGGDT